MSIQIIRGKYSLSIHVVWALILVTALLASRFLQSSTCMFHELTGLPCLTCGSSRAVQALFAGDFLGMLYFNPLVILFCGVLFFFSLFKLLEFIFRFEIRVNVNRKFSFAARMTAITLIAANWLFLVVTGR